MSAGYDTRTIFRGGDNPHSSSDHSPYDSCGLPSSILDALSAHIAVFDLNGTIIYVNRAWRDFAEANHTEPGSVCVGANYFTACEKAQGEDAPLAAKALQSLREILSGRSSRCSFEYPCHSPDEKRWFSANFIRCDDNGKTRLITAHEIITERVIAQEELQAKAREYRLMFDEAGDGIILRDEHGNILNANHTVAEMFGYRLQELLTLNTQALLSSDDLAILPLEEVNRRCKAGETLRIERNCQKKDGSHFWAQLTIRLISREQGHFQVLIRDVNNKKRSEEELKRHAEILQTVFDNLPVMILLIDMKGKVVLTNRFLAKCLGWRTEEIRGAQEAFWGQLFSENLEKEAFLRLLSEASGRSVDFQTRTKSGRNIQTSWAFARLSDGAALGIGQDITARKEAEEALKQEHQKIRQMEAELRLAQKLEAVGQLAAGIAHEINTPMQYIGDSIEFLQTAFSDLTPIISAYRSVLDTVSASDNLQKRALQLKKQEEDIDLPYLSKQIPRALERSKEGVERVATIVRAMREFAHPDQSEKELQDVNRILQNVLTVSRNEYKYVAEVETDFDESLLPVPCHTGELGQVFLNLVVNAAHAIGDKVAGTEQKGRIRVSTRSQGERVLIEIEDSGTGIPEKIRQRIFDPFFTTKPVGKGTGQGLAIARTIIVEKHAGTIHFESEVGRGTIFRIELPSERKGSGDAGGEKTDSFRG